ncbi:hypothetical protein [Methylobacterium sp. J-090]|uniref:hypothetical protein n=1 Tax=Methylobacterium sp. J-090 TaxID=2836666 RepID=UPI001FBBA040|nr:hypothetical protein [Methylobacterium sp. J-090]MCJ2082487.1 hypothetical protein [Methylobacterium sp. J-090]
MDEAVLDLLERLVTVRRELGENVYQDAVERAVIGVGVAAHIEAERVALRHARLRPVGNVISLPARQPLRETAGQARAPGGDNDRL